MKELTIEEKTILWKPVSEYTGGRVLATNGLDILVGELNPEGDCVSEDCSGIHLCGITHFAKIAGFFPELQESEDERIRKALIKSFEIHDLRALIIPGFSAKDVIAWLEKQGEPTDINPSEFDLRLNKLLKQFETLPKEELASSLSFYLNVVQNDGTYKREEKQGEQNPADKLEDEEYNGEDYGIDSLYHAQRILEKTLGKVDGYQSDDGILEHKCAITAIKKLYEQKPAEWSEKDKDNIQRALYYVDYYQTHEADTKEAEECFDWLKSLKPQNKCVYNPYKEVVVSIAEMCKHYDKASHSGLRDFYDNVKVKCKDATEYDHLFPQNHWKPTEEQMNTMKYLAKYYAKGCDEPTRSIIEGLYEQLKQL